MIHQSLLIVGSLLILLAAGWELALAPRWTQRLPPDWTWQANYIGITAAPDPATGRFPADNRISTYQRSVAIASATERPRVVKIRDSYIIRDVETGAVAYEYIIDAMVDPATGAYTAPALQGQVLVFPRHAEKKTYRLRASYLKGVPLDYQGEENIGGLTTYVYGYQGRGEYTQSYAGTERYPGAPLAAGQEVKCAGDQFYLKVWVEPLTGETLKLDEGCPSGDYVYDIATGRQLAPVVRWAGTTAGDDILIRADQIRADRRRLLWFDRYLPAGAALIGLLVLGWAGVRRAVVGARG
ncbi:porin PorA family protein [uncultured Thiodictyon sp.]|uniref:porin PorA family protein n=1 Tax=uncultured Thiodictyon sp. TaxID=1846217 RepID=UPI0025F89E64|nr:porin PorA family protein [uncultured Thiodictyon sp.]